jgi:hypothetical protein
MKSKEPFYTTLIKREMKPYFAFIEATLEELGATKSRVEITKWGKHILKEILKNPS